MGLRAVAAPGNLIAVHDFGGPFMKRLLTPVALALVVAFASLAGSPATASAKTSIDMLNSLTFPHQSAGHICSAERRIRLKGKWRYAAYTKHRLHASTLSRSRVIRLNGVYNWRVCLHRRNRKTYEVHTRIRNVRTGGYAGVTYVEYGTIYGNGYYDWGAFFDKEF
jgi:hypothetical protein